MKRLLPLLCAAAMLSPMRAQAAKYVGISVVDKDYVCLQFRDGEIRYRDDGTGPSAYLGHSFSPGDDTLLVFHPRLNITGAEGFVITSENDRSYGSEGLRAEAVYRKSKPMHTDNTLSNELEHWVFVRLPRSMKQGCSYTVSIPHETGSDAAEAEILFDIFSSVSEAVHVNILGYSPDAQSDAADLYLWLGEGGPRDYSSFEGKRVWLYNVDSGIKSQAGKVRFWKARSDSANEAGGQGPYRFGCLEHRFHRQDARHLQARGGRRGMQHGFQGGPRHIL